MIMNTKGLVFKYPDNVDTDVIIPNGNDCIKLGDNVIVVTTHKNFDDLTDILE